MTIQFKMPVDPSMEFGGYVEPPSHLAVTSKKKAPEGRPPELRTIPDYDYSLFRYSKVSLPGLLLIIVTAALLIGLTFWQGPFGYQRGVNGLQNARPLEFINERYEEHKEAGLKVFLRSLRCANFAMGMAGLIICIFALRASPSPTILRIFLFLCAFIFFALGCCSAVSFAFGIDQVHRLKDCPDYTFPTMHWSPFHGEAGDRDSAYFVCWRREQLSTATVAADICQSLTAFLLCGLLIYTSLNANWAWGPGSVPLEKDHNKPKALFPPPSPFTHIASTRRAYVWFGIVMLMIFVLVAFILTMIMHELRIKPKQVNFRNQVVFKSGWPIRLNRLRLSIASFIVAFSSILLIDMFGWRRRLISYIFGMGLFWCAVGMFISFIMDCVEVGNTKKDIDCPDGVECGQAAFIGTCVVSFFLSFFVFIFVLVEFLFRSFRGWSTFYFYADSEWLRNHSLFVDQTDREAFDWKKFVLDSGKEYYYSPSLGISTRMPPHNYVEPEGGLLPANLPLPGTPGFAPL